MNTKTRISMSTSTDLVAMTPKQRTSSRRKSIISSKSGSNGRKQQQQQQKQKQKQQRYHPHDGHPTVLSDEDRLKGLASRWWTDHLRSSDWLRFKPPNRYCEDYGYIPVQYVQQARERLHLQQQQQQQQNTKTSSSKGYIVKYVMKHGKHGEHYAIGYMDLYNLLRKYGTFKNDDDENDEILMDYNGPPLVAVDVNDTLPPPPPSPPSPPSPPPLVQETVASDIGVVARDQVITTAVASAGTPLSPPPPPLFTSTPNRKSSSTDRTCTTSADKLWSAAETISGMNRNSIANGEIVPSSSSSTAHGNDEEDTVSSDDTPVATTADELEEARMIAEVMIGVKKGFFLWPSTTANVTTNDMNSRDDGVVSAESENDKDPSPKKRKTTTTKTTATFDEKRDSINTMFEQMSSDELDTIQMDLTSIIKTKKRKI